MLEDEAPMWLLNRLKLFVSLNSPFEFTLSSALVSCFLLFVLSFLLAFIFLPLGVHANAETVLWAITLSLISALGVRFLKRFGAHALMSIFALSILMYFLPRVFEYLTVDRDTLKNLYVFFPQKWSPEDINQGLRFVTLGTLFSIAGLATGGALSRRLLNPDQINLLPPPRVSGWALLACAVVIFGVESYFTLYHGMSASSNCTKAEAAGVWLIHFFSGDIFIFVFLTMFLPRISTLEWRGKAAIALVVLAYCIYMILHGSRGGVLRVSMIAFAVWVAFVPLPRFRIASLFRAFIPILLAAAFTYVAGSFIRYSNMSHCSVGGEFNVVKAMKDDLSEEREVPSYFADTPSSELKSQDAKALRLPPVLAAIGDRLGLIDYPIGVVSAPRNTEAMRQYMSLSYMSRNFANNIVLGEPFPEAKYMTSNMMAIIFRGRDPAYVSENFQADAWTAWGSFYALFGFVGALIALFISGFLLQTGLDWGTQVVPGPFRLYFRAVYIWIVALGVVFFHMSPDHAAILLVYCVFQLLTTLTLVYGFDGLFSRRWHSMNPEETQT